jgi:hypothetical protein
MKKTPFGAFLTPALTGRPPAEIRIDGSLLGVVSIFKLGARSKLGSGLRFSRFLELRTSAGRLGEAGEAETMMKNLSALSIRQPYAER